MDRPDENKDGLRSVVSPLTVFRLGAVGADCPVIVEIQVAETALLFEIALLD